MGSAYYRNIRVWDLLSADILVVESFNNKYYEYNENEYPKSLILYYPLTIKYMDKNKIIDYVNQENILVTHKSTLNLDSNDNFLFYNYEMNIDLYLEDVQKIYIESIGEDKEIGYIQYHENCKRSFSTSSTEYYECEEGFAFIGKEYVTDTYYFVRTPIKLSLNTKTQEKEIDTLNNIQYLFG